MRDVDVEPVVDAAALADAIAPGDVEGLRPLLPVGYRAGAAAYRAAVADLDADDLTTHYTDGLSWFTDTFGPALLRRVEALTGGAWSLDGWTVVGGSSDVDLMTHLVEAVAARGPVSLYPGDWWGFRVGGTHDDRVRFSDDAADAADLACLCVPSVRNGHLTAEQLAFLGRAPVQLLNLNLFPTLAPVERHAVATALAPLLPTSLVSISFSRGFGLTASQLGVLLVPPGHPWSDRFRRQWEWSTFFHNAIAARAFLHVDLDAVAAVDAERREWCAAWLADRGLPTAPGGSYYVHALRPDGPVADHLAPLVRDGRLRLCLKPTPA